MTAAALAWAAGCAPRADPRALIFRGWAYEPDLVRLNLEKYRSFYPHDLVDYSPVSGNYHDKMVAQFIAGNRLDVVYVRDDNFAEWVEAGWLQSLAGLADSERYGARMFPLNREAMTWRGELYGLPYYTDFQTWVWNREMLERAGLDGCGRTLPEITEQCIRLKEARITGPDGIIELPLAFGFRLAPVGFIDFWALMYASEVELFNDDLEPLFPDDPGRKAERVLQWVVDGIHKHRIIDLEASFTTQQIRDLFAAGRKPMSPINKYDMQRVNDPGRSQVAGQGVMARYPSLEPGQSGTIGWTRMYGVPRTAADPAASWKLLEFLGGEDPDGELSTPRFWYLQRGLGFAYPELFDDPAVQESTSRWGDPGEIERQAATARPRGGIMAPWFAEFDNYYQAELQEVLQARRSPRDGLARIAAFCRRLRKEWT